MWTYRCYDDGGDPNLWARWYAENPKAQGSHDAIFRILEHRSSWGPPHTEFLNKEERILEVRLTGNPKHRILGFYGTARQEFVVLAICMHKQIVYSPPGIKKTVVKRKKEVEANQSKARPCVRPS